MADIAIGTYVNFQLFSGGNTDYAFQNFHSGGTRVYDGIEYLYAGFGFSGASVDLQGSNIRAQLVFSMNQLTANIFNQAADERWIAKVRTVQLDPDTFEETSVYTEETFQVVSYQHNGSRFGLDLGSPLDAVAGQSPRRTLSQYLVGSLPSTGQIGFT